MKILKNKKGKDGFSWFQRFGDSEDTIMQEITPNPEMGMAIFNSNMQNGGLSMAEDIDEAFLSKDTLNKLKAIFMGLLNSGMEIEIDNNEDLPKGIKIVKNNGKDGKFKYLGKYFSFNVNPDGTVNIGTSNENLTESDIAFNESIEDGILQLIATDLRDYCKENKLYLDEIYIDNGKIVVEINAGDWKHEHNYFSDLLNDFFIKLNKNYTYSKKITKHYNGDYYDAEYYIDIFDSPIISDEATEETELPLYINMKENCNMKLIEEFSESNTTYLSDILDLIIGNMEDADINKLIKKFNRFAKILKVKNPEKLVAYIDEYGTYIPSLFYSDAVKIYDDSKYYDDFSTESVPVIDEEINGIHYLWFSSKEDLDKYIKEVDKINIYDESLHESLLEDVDYSDKFQGPGNYTFYFNVNEYLDNGNNNARTYIENYPNIYIENKVDFNDYINNKLKQNNVKEFIKVKFFDNDLIKNESKDTSFNKLTEDTTSGKYLTNYRELSDIDSDIITELRKKTNNAIKLHDGDIDDDGTMWLDVLFESSVDHSAFRSILKDFFKRNKKSFELSYVTSIEAPEDTVYRYKLKILNDGADTRKKAGNILWDFDEDTGTLTIDGTGEMNIKSFTMPWDDNIQNIKTVIINEGVTNIESGVFRDHEALTSITIPDSVTSIGNSAFYGCNALTSITIPDSVTNIGMYAFYGCEALTSITIPNSVKNLEEYAFANCFELESAKISGSVGFIKERCFQDCHQLKTVKIQEGVYSIGKEAFEYCYNIENIYMPKSVRDINSYAFSECRKATIYYNGPKSTYNTISISSKGNIPPVEYAY